jgi:DNA-binding NarL/FixJ family response regulator
VVLLVEEDVLARLSSAAMLEGAEFRVLPVASAQEALQVLGGGFRIQAVVTDASLSQSSMDGFELARSVLSEWGVGVEVLSGRATLEQGELPPGAHFLSKPVHGATLVSIVQHLVLSRSQSPPGLTNSDQVASHASAEPDARWTLTPRQHEVLALLMQGKANRDIADVLGLSENTVKVHVAAIFRALGVSSRTEAMLEGMKHNSLR